MKKTQCPKCSGPSDLCVILSMVFEYEFQTHWKCPRCGWVPECDKDGKVMDYVVRMFANRGTLIPEKSNDPFTEGKRQRMLLENEDNNV